MRSGRSARIASNRSRSQWKRRQGSAGSSGALTSGERALARRTNRTRRRASGAAIRPSRDWYRRAEAWGYAPLAPGLTRTIPRRTSGASPGQGQRQGTDRTRRPLFACPGESAIPVPVRRRAPPRRRHARRCPPDVRRALASKRAASKRRTLRQRCKHATPGTDDHVAPGDARRRPKIDRRRGSGYATPCRVL